MNAPVTGHRPASQPLAGLLLGLLTALLLLTLALPLLNPVSWLGRAAPLILGPADQPIATLNRYSLLYKSDNRGFYLVVRSQWQLLKPLQEGDKVRVELLNDKGVRIDQLSQAVDKRQKCRKERCTLSLNSALRAPDDALDSRYQLRIGLLLADRPESAEYSQILQTLPERGFNLLYLMTSLLLVLLVSAAVLKALLPRLRRSYRARVAGSLLLGNLTFVLLHGFVVFKLGEFLFWSGFRPEHYYLAWGSMVLGWSLCALAGFSLYMGLLFTALSGIGLLANFMKIAIYGVPLGGGRSGQPAGPAAHPARSAPCGAGTRRAGAPFSGVALRPLPLDPAGLAAHRRRHRRLLCPLRVRHPDRQQAAWGQHPLRGQGGELPQGHHPRRPRPLPV